MRFPASRLAATLLATLAVACLLAPGLRAQEEWRSPPPTDVTYRINAELRSVQRGKTLRPAIVGRQQIEWRNTSAEPVAVLYFHLYANAFRNTRSSMFREAFVAGWELPDDMEFGELHVQEIALVSGEPLQLQYVSPDDGNGADRTVARAVLPSPVLPGESVAVRLRFTTVLPRVVRRMGRQGRFVMAAQWYPKLGRYVGSGGAHPATAEGWYCNQYHWTSEFCADYANYEVSLTVPDDLKTGATGDRMGTSVDENGLRTERYAAQGVVDFAWTAHDRYLVLEREVDPFEPRGDDPGADPVLAERRRLADLLGLPEEQLTLPKVAVTVLLQPEHADQAERHFEAARVALGLYGLWLGPYPYSRLTIVDPPHGGRQAGGMEYPQLVTAGTREGSPLESQRPEGVIVHEIGHQWFMNILANNEAEEAWLDEGLNTYFTARALDAAYGPATQVTRVMGRHLLVTPFFDFEGLGAGWPDLLNLPDWAKPPRMEVFRAWRDLPPLTGLRTPRYVGDPLLARRGSYLRSAGWDEMIRPSWDYVNRASYGGNAYSRPALLVATLRRSLRLDLGDQAGEAAFFRGMREYARRQRFTHPTTADFLAAFAAGSGWDPSAVFEALTATGGVLDYAVESIDRERTPALRGWNERDGRPVLVEEAPTSGYGVASVVGSSVLVRRRGDVVVPVRLQVTRERGAADEVTWETVEWDGRDRWRRFVFDGEVVAARLHPQGQYPQDVDRRNDTRKVDADYRPGVKWGVRFLLWLENAALSYGRFL